QLAGREARVILASREASRAEAAAKKVGHGAGWVALDITDPKSVEAAARTLGQQYERLDVLVNNSAILLDHYGSILDLKPEMLRETLETNVVGTLRVTQAL